MELTEITGIISALGFPIFCALALGWFSWYMVKHMSDQLASLQERCQKREDALRREIKESQGINNKFAEIIAKYDVKLDIIHNDISTIKNDIVAIKNEIGEDNK